MQLLTLIKIARLNKQLVLTDSFIELDSDSQQVLVNLGHSPFKLPNQDLLTAIKSADSKLVLEAIGIISSEQKASSQVVAFEYQMCSDFIRNCLITTFPETRQNSLKAVK